MSSENTGGNGRRIQVGLGGGRRTPHGYTSSRSYHYVGACDDVGVDDIGVHPAVDVRIRDDVGRYGVVGVHVSDIGFNPWALDQLKRLPTVGRAINAVGRVAVSFTQSGVLQAEIVWIG